MDSGARKVPPLPDSQPELKRMRTAALEAKQAADSDWTQKQTQWSEKLKEHVLRQWRTFCAMYAEGATFSTIHTYVPTTVPWQGRWTGNVEIEFSAKSGSLKMDYNRPNQEFKGLNETDRKEIIDTLTKNGWIRVSVSHDTSVIVDRGIVVLRFTEP